MDDLFEFRLIILVYGGTFRIVYFLDYMWISRNVENYLEIVVIKFLVWCISKCFDVLKEWEFVNKTLVIKVYEILKSFKLIF